MGSDTAQVRHETRQSINSGLSRRAGPHHHNNMTTVCPPDAMLSASGQWALAHPSEGRLLLEEEFSLTPPQLILPH